MGLRTLAAVSGLAHFFEEIALPIGPDSEPANADWLKKVKHTYSMQRFSQWTYYNSLQFWLFWPEKDLFWKQDGGLVQGQKKAHQNQSFSPR